MGRLAHDIFHLHTKFGDSRFSYSGDMIAGVEIENRSCDHAVLGVVCHPKARILYSLPFNTYTDKQRNRHRQATIETVVCRHQRRRYR